MRIEVGGAQITDSVVEILETLQTQRELSTIYLQVLDDVSRFLILDITSDEEKDAETMHRLRALQMIRKGILTLSAPPDENLPENDIPAASL